MSIVGIVAEYNPFHNGHLYHLKNSKRITNSNFSIAIMSPNFVQRGSPAFTDKWTRTKMALLSGIDLVIELPTPYAVASAEFFARGSVSLLHHTGIIDYISFGSESNNLELLKTIASILNNEPPQLKEFLMESLKNGSNFPKARSNALKQYLGELPSLKHLSKEFGTIIQSPNNILGIEYIKALQRLNSNIIPVTMKRIANNYHDTNIVGNIASATAVRNHLSGGTLKDVAKTMPVSSYDLLLNNIYEHQKYMDVNDLSDFLRYRLLFSTKKDLRKIVGVTEGIENRIFDMFDQTESVQEMVNAIKSKRFTYTAIQRILLNIILQLKKEDFKAFEHAGGPLYIRVLGFRKSSQHLLAEMKKKATLPLVINIKRDYSNLSPLAQRMLDIEMRSTNIYSSLQHSKNHYNLDFKHPIVKI